MPRVPILFATESAVSRSPPVSSERLSNCFVERQPPGAKSPAPIFGRPGLDTFALAPDRPARGCWNFNGLAYFVGGQTLYSVDASGNAVACGSGINGTGLVSMSDNGMQLIIVNGGGPGGGGWIYTVAGGLIGITDPNFYPSDSVIFFDGYFVLNRSGTNEFFLSALYDGTSYNGLDFASAEAEPGVLTAVVQNLQLLFLICSKHLELWYDAGTEDFPFQRYAGGVINYGCISPQAIVKQDGAIFFLGADKVFYRLQANVPIRVSTHPIETAIAKEPDISLASCMTFTLEGHKFIFLTLPASGQTLVFDISTGKWHEWESWNSMDGTFGRWRANCCLEIYQTILTGDEKGVTIGEVDWTVNTEYDLMHPIRLLAQSVVQHHNRYWLFVDEFQLDIQAGVGTATDQGADPQVMLSVSKDGGVTFGPFKKWRSMGKIGAYTTRLRWLSMGRGRQWVFKVEITDPVIRVIIGATASIMVGTS